MATVIDALTVSLGLDPSAFKKGSKEVSDTSKKTSEEVVKSGKSIEESSKKAADSISKVAREVLGLYAIFVGARGIKEFVNDLVSADAALGRFSRNLNTSPQTLDAWGNAAQRMGGSAEATAGTFERIGKALYDLHRNGAALPKEYAQLQALTGLRIDRDHGVDKFLQDTAAALQKMNSIDPAQAHFLASGMGIDDATANVMIKYGAAIGTYIDNLKKLSPSNDAIKAAQDLQDKWATLQQTAVALANTILDKLGPEMAKLLTQMTDWIAKNSDWLQSGIVDAVKKFADYLKSVDWNAVGQGLKDFGNDAKHVADAIGGITTATEILFALWAGSKALGFLAGVRTLVGGGGGAAAAGTAAAGGGAGILGVLGKVFAVAGAAYMLTDTASGPSQGKINAAEKNAWYNRPSDASGHADALQNNFGGLGNGRDASLDAFLDGGAKVDGRPVSKSNPLPVVNADQSAGGGFWSRVGTAISSFFGGGTAPAGSPSVSANGGPLQASGKSAGTPGWWTADRQKHAYDRLTKEAGLSDMGAKGLISRWVNVEASGGPNESNNIGGGHFGIAQWSRSRGRSIWGNPDYDAQLSLAIGELNGPEKVAASLLRNAKTAEQGATGASSFERAENYNPFTHRDDWTGKTLGGMRGIDKYVGSAMSAQLSSISNDNRSTSSNSSHEVSVGSIHINAPQAKDANGIADKVADSLYRSTAAATANYGPR